MGIRKRAVTGPGVSCYQGWPANDVATPTVEIQGGMAHAHRTAAPLARRDATGMWRDDS